MIDIISSNGESLSQTALMYPHTHPGMYEETRKVLFGTLSRKPRIYLVSD